MKIYLCQSAESSILDTAQTEAEKLRTRLNSMFPDDFTIICRLENGFGDYVSVVVINATKETVSNHILHNASFISKFFIDLNGDSNGLLPIGSKVKVEYTTGTLRTNGLQFRAITKTLPDALRSLGDWFEKNKQAILSIEKH